MDIAESEGQYKIVEYNCWNGSALYLSDSMKLFSIVDSVVSHKMSNKPTSEFEDENVFTSRKRNIY